MSEIIYDGTTPHITVGYTKPTYTHIPSQDWRGKIESFFLVESSHLSEEDWKYFMSRLLEDDSRVALLLEVINNE